MNEDKKDKKGFFSRMLNSEHKVFEMSMFGISVILSLALVVGLGYYTSEAFFNTDTITDEEANASSVTDGAITVDEDDEDAEPTATPYENAMVNEEDMGNEVDPDLADATEGYTTTSVNMRSEPSLTASVVTKVPSGVKLSFIKLYNDEWMKVDYNGTTGYINAMYLSVDKPEPIATVAPEVTKAPATATPSATATPKVKKTPKPTKKPTVTKKPKPTAAPTTEAPTEVPATAAPTEVPATAAPTQDSSMGDAVSAE